MQVYYFDMTLFSEKYYLNTNDNQISGIAYNTIEQTYYGLEKLDVDNVLHVELEEEWVEKNFPDDFLTVVKEKASTDLNKFIKVPVGHAKPTMSPECIHKNPTIKFLQDGKDNCVFSSIASATFFLGYEDLAYKIMSFEHTFAHSNFDPKYKSLLGVVSRKLCSLDCRTFNRDYQLRRIKFPQKFDLVRSAKENPTSIYHVVIRGADCSINHCVSIVNNYLFDGNYTNAWGLNYESLKQCLDSDFVGIEHGYMHVKYNVK
jgi:hypothetical protein